MKNSILFVLCISVSTAIGFMAGFYFYEQHKFSHAEFVRLTLKHTDQLQDIVDSYQRVREQKKIIAELNAITSINELETLKARYSNILDSYIEDYESKSIRTQRGNTTTYTLEPVDREANETESGL